MMTFNFGLLTATVMAVIPSGSWPAHIDSHGFKAHIVYVAFVLYQGCQVYYCLCGETDEIFDFVTGSNQSPYFRKPLCMAIWPYHVMYTSTLIPDKHLEMLLVSALHIVQLYTCSPPAGERQSFTRNQHRPFNLTGNNCFDMLFRSARLDTTLSSLFSI